MKFGKYEIYPISHLFVDFSTNPLKNTTVMQYFLFYYDRITAVTIELAPICML